MKRLSRLPVGVAALLALATGSANAQVITHDGSAQAVSPQDFAFELRLGPFRPNIDSEFGSSSPHKTYFGSSRHLMTQIEFDYQFFHKFGSIGVGLGVGYFSQSTKAFMSDGTTRSTDSTDLALAPVSLSLVYRFDWLSETQEIPLVPYFKVGIDYTLWAISNGNGNTAKWTSQDGIRTANGKGGTAGWHAAVGISLVLDKFDPDAARQLDLDAGINHTHLFFEFGTWVVDGLGQANRLHVGDSTWTAGLMFEF